MRCIDLQRFNVFDFDAYGCPWEQMLLLLHHRQWGEAEVGGVVLTDGSSLKLRWGSMSTAAATLLGGSRDDLPRSDGGTDGLQRILLKRWCNLAKVKPRHCWRAEGRGSGAGGARMAYTALVFEGQPAASKGS